MANALRILIVVAIALNGSKATAEKFAIVGGGTQSCGTMIANLSTDEGMSFFYKAWMQGYLSAANVFTRTSDAYVDLADHDGQWLWLKNYCEENPLNAVIQGVQTLVNELAASQGLPPFTLPASVDPTVEKSSQ